MMNLGHEERWQAYLIPGTDVLRNKLGIKTNDELRAAEADLVEVRIAELRAAPDRIARTYDLQHLRAVHLQLFQDIYDWAGAIRTVGIAKGGESFIPPANIATYGLRGPK